ncbi:MAG: GntR family transcriptional regulator, partial [Desulfosudaceae bacterium]
MMTFQASRNLPEQVADYLKDRIVRLKLLPGERIIEKRVAEETGVSQAPVREALRIMERHYLVEILPRKGARVTEMTHSMLEWLFDVAFLLLPLVARRGIENGQAQDIVDLRQALDVMEKCARENDVVGHIYAIAEYASVSTLGTKNPFLLEMVNQLWPATM